MHLLNASKLQQRKGKATVKDFFGNLSGTEATQVLAVAPDGRCFDYVLYQGLLRCLQAELDIFRLTNACLDHRSLPATAQDYGFDNETAANESQ